VIPALRHVSALTGRPGSRYQIPTPALVVDLDALDRNIARMASRAATAGIALRPHAKTHKSAFIADRQIAAGAVGICCAKLGEAEALASAGVRGLLVTSPIVGSSAAARAVELFQLDSDLTLVADHTDQIDSLAAAASAASIRLSVMIDIDVGLGRTGVATPAGANALADRIERYPALRLAGVQGYGGHWQHIVGAENRRASVNAGMKRLAAAIEALRASGRDIAIVTGGGTGTFAADAALGLLNEAQPGSYVFMDAQYRDALGVDEDAFEQSLFVQAQVVSANAEPWVTVDAGLKAFATDGPLPRPTGPRFGGSSYFYFGDEHGGLSRPAKGPPVELGERVEFIPPHCDPTVDRYDVIFLVRDDVLIDTVSIEAARRSQ
jgi:D-serine deaminase-like pyridoxal phosphate-dependent protein